MAVSTDVDPGLREQPLGHFLLFYVSLLRVSCHTSDSRDYHRRLPKPPQLIAPQIWPECSQRQHNRINNRVHAHIATAHSATAHSATDLVECSQRQHNRINNRIHANSATAHSATGHSAKDLAGVLTAPQLIAPQI
ncbi:hypothetical protein J6590_075029 [Homalodisca vitripennis]|nr:hypothetical protein J6590_075029 [Homalodisca vitripennis]